MATNGGLEFQRYAGVVAQQLQARGYTPASNAQSANMIVQFGYGVDRGQVRYVDDPFYGGYGRFGFGGLYGGRLGHGFYRPRFGWGWGGGLTRGAGTIRSGTAAGSTAMSNIIARSISTSARPRPTRRCSTAVPRRARKPTGSMS